VKETGMKARSLRLAVAFVLVLGGTVLAIGNASGAPAPTCSVIAPAAGQVSGSIPLAAGAQNAGSVEFFANGADIGPPR
jgi:hypothetical protein